MASVNKVILVGRLGRDPEIRSTQSGQAVANFTIATDETWKDKSGEKQKKTEWHNLVVWGATVENFVQPYLHKGDMVYVEGKLQTRKWTDKEGNDKYTTEINVTDIKGIVSGGNGESTKPAATSRPANATGSAVRRPVQRPAQPTQSADEDFAF